VLIWTIWLAFVGEAALMLYVVNDRTRWLRDHRSTWRSWC
jgi:hypothetical protein